MSQQTAIRCVLMRGGTSKGGFFHEADLPADRELCDRILLAAFGSPDPRQIDGLGGSYSTTSKAAIIARGARPGIDVNYTFAQVTITAPLVDYRGNCGNISSAVGPFAIDEGLVEDGRAAVEGDCRIAGVPRTGARIRLGFVDPAGSVTGKLLPTGRAVDVLDVRGLGKVEASLVDAANPVVFVRASDVGLTGAEAAEELDNTPGALDRLERIRSAGAQAMGIVDNADRATQISPAVPKVAVVAPPRDYQAVGGLAVRSHEVDLLARIMSLQRTHRAYALTGAIATAAAAAVPGSLVAESVGRDARGAGRFRIGHPAGSMTLEVVTAPMNGGVQMLKVIAERTARRLMDGYVYVPTRVWRPVEERHGQFA